jgi:hypothetical protein
MTSNLAETDMNVTMLVDLVQKFLGEGFSLDKATALLGPIAEQERGNLILVPDARWGCRQIVLETNSDKEGEPVVVGIVLTFSTPLRLSMQELSGKWGEATKLPRLKPSQPIPNQFRFREPMWQGYALVEADRADTVPRVIIRRQRLE